MIQSGIYSSVNGQITTTCHLSFTSHLTLTGVSLLLISNILISRTAFEAAIFRAKDQVVKICELQETDLHRQATKEYVKHATIALSLLQLTKSSVSIENVQNGSTKP